MTKYQRIAILIMCLIMLSLSAYNFYKYSHSIETYQPKGLTISNETERLTVSHFEPYSVYVVGNTKARISCYNTSGIMANGEQTFIGAVAVSDRSIPLNSTAYVEDFGEFKITDRTNKRIHNQFGMLTIDIYSPDCDKYFGIKYKNYIIIK